MVGGTPEADAGGERSTYLSYIYFVRLRSLQLLPGHLGQGKTNMQNFCPVPNDLGVGGKGKKVYESKTK